MVVAIFGATASGKSALALDLARRHDDIELVSVDSMQVYRGMDIGTAKPTPAEQAEVRHHLIDLAEPDEDFTVSRFQVACGDVLADIEARGKRAVLVGGTGLYLRAVVDDLTIPGQYPDVWAELDRDPDTAALHARLTQVDPMAASRMEPTNRRRVVRALEVSIGSGRPFSSFGPGLDAYPPTRFGLVGIDLDHGSCWRTSAASAPSTTRSTRRSVAPAGLRAVSDRGSAVIRASSGSGPTKHCRRWKRRSPGTLRPPCD
jgi:tRNA dimethylallyltransferase